MLLWKSEFLPDFPPFHLKRKPSTFIPHVLLIEASENIESAFSFFFKAVLTVFAREYTQIATFRGELLIGSRTSY